MAPLRSGVRGLAACLSAAAGLFAPASSMAMEAAQARQIDAFVGICVLQQAPETFGLEQCGRGHGIAFETGVLCRSEDGVGKGTDDDPLSVSIRWYGSGNDPVHERMCEIHLRNAEAVHVAQTLKERLNAIEPDLAGSITNEPPALRVHRLTGNDARSRTSIIRRQIRIWRDRNELLATLHSSEPNPDFKPKPSQPAGRK